MGFNRGKRPSLYSDKHGGVKVNLCCIILHVDSQLETVVRSRSVSPQVEVERDEDYRKSHSSSPESPPSPSQNRSRISRSRSRSDTCVSSAASQGRARLRINRARRPRLSLSSFSGSSVVCEVTLREKSGEKKAPDVSYLFLVLASITDTLVLFCRYRLPGPPKGSYS